MMVGSVLLEAKKILKEVGVKPGDKLADFGVGRSGHFALQASRVVGEKGHVYAVDILKDVLKMLDKHCGLQSTCNITTIWGDFERLCGVPIESETLDHVLVIHDMWCTKDVAALAREAKRLLKLDGRLTIIDWRKETKNPIAPKKEMRRDKVEVKRKLVEAGFKFIEEIDVDRDHWGFIVRNA